MQNAEILKKSKIFALQIVFFDIYIRISEKIVGILRETWYYVFVRYAKDKNSRGVSMQAQEPMYPARFAHTDGVARWQSVSEHLRSTAEYAAENLRGVGLDRVGYLAGLLHDMGKYTAFFKEYIEKASKGESVVKGSVNHTFAGVIYLFERYHAELCSSYKDITCEIIGYAIGAHHGLFDCISGDRSDGFMHRIKKDKNDICYNEAVNGFLRECASESEIDECFLLAQEQASCDCREGRKSNIF